MLNNSKDTPGKRDYRGVRVAAVSLGCSKNRIDTEEMLARLAEWGCQLIEDCSKADIVMVNTCGFIEDAQQESINTLLETARQGKSNQKVVAAGCLVEVFGDKLLDHMPEISAAIGVHSYKNLDQLMESIINEKRICINDSPGPEYEEFGQRILTKPPHSVNVKIAEGCSNRCHYCLIPSIRGPYRSRSPEAIINEIKSLVDKGTREICLVAQDTTSYGKDIEKYPDLERLISMIMAAVDQHFWLRIMYTYPSRITDGLISLISEEERICNYLDIPIQHSSDRVLKAMGRSYRRRDLNLLFEKLRSMIPGIVLRTTCMVGYPGERTSDFRELLDFVKENRLERLGAFLYSAQKGTAAYKSSGQVPKRVMNKRLQTLMLTQSEVAFKENKKMCGRIISIIVDRPSSLTGWYYGRSCSQAPEVDGSIYFYSKEVLNPGKLLKGRVFAASPYNLLALAKSTDTRG